MADISVLGWIGIAIVLVGWWISNAIGDGFDTLAEAIKEINDPPDDDAA